MGLINRKGEKRGIMKRLIVKTAKHNAFKDKIEKLKEAYLQNHIDMCNLEADKETDDADIAYVHGYENAMNFVFKTLGIDVDV